MTPLLAWLLHVVARSAVSVVAASPEGALCQLDRDTGVLLAATAVSATDVLADAAGAVWTVEPGDEQTGRLARYRFSPAGAALERVLPFDARDGRVIVAADPPILLALAEGATLAVAHDTGATGLAWPTSASALAFDGTSIVTLDDATVPWRFHRALIGPGGVTSLGAVAVPTPDAVCGARAVMTPRGPALIYVAHGVVTLASGGHPLLRAHVPITSCVEDAMSLPDGRVVALVGPAPTLVILSATGSRVVALPSGPLPHVPWLSHRIAYDPERERLWLATDHALTALDLWPTPVIAPLTPGCAATAVTLAGGPSVPSHP